MPSCPLARNPTDRRKDSSWESLSLELCCLGFRRRRESLFQHLWLSVTREQSLKHTSVFFPVNALNRLNVVASFFATVALNYQSEGRMLQLNRAKFNANGNCGYILKPKCMCQGKEKPASRDCRGRGRFLWVGTVLYKGKMCGAAMHCGICQQAMGMEAIESVTHYVWA